MKLKNVTKAKRCDVCHEFAPEFSNDIFTDSCARCLPILKDKSYLLVADYKFRYRFAFFEDYLLNSQSAEDRVAIDFTVISVITFCLSINAYILTQTNGQEVSAIFGFNLLFAIFSAMFIYMKYEECYADQKVKHESIEHI